MATHRAASLDARPAGGPLQAPDAARTRVSSGGDADCARPALPRKARHRRRHPEAGRPRADDRCRVLRPRRSAEPRDERRADVLHGLDGRADPGRLAQHALPASAEALARLLRAKPRRRDHQPPHERRRSARPARHRRRHDTHPEHALPLRHLDHPLLPRLAAGARDADRDAPHVHRDRDLPRALGPRLPGGSRPARARHRDPRRRHQWHASRPGVPARAHEPAQLRRGQRALPGGEPADGRPQRPLLPVRRLPVVRSRPRS